MVRDLIYIFFLISQLGRHFWPEWSFISGIKIDYLSPTVYFLDLIWLSIFLEKSKKSDFRFKHGETWVILGLAILNIVLAKRWQLAVYGWLRMGQFWWTVRYFSQKKKEIKRILVRVIPWWIAIETFLGLAQVVTGGSIGGLYYWLGERRFDYMSLGVARISWFDSQYIRAYGTFSHPNSLAGFILVAMMIWNRNAYMRSVLTENRLRKWIVNWIGVVGLLITGSRMVWFTGSLILFIRSKVKFGWKLVGLGLVMMTWAFLATNMEVVGGWSVSSTDLRWKLFKSSLEIFKGNWLFGVGVDNFLVNLPNFMTDYWWLQPVHNIFMLGLVETGVVGMWMILRRVIKSVDFGKYGWVWLVIILTGMFDHYWLTLPQNVGLLAVVMGLSKKID